MPVLEVENLSVSFRVDKKTRITAVRDVTFSVDRGSTLGIVGESGCGKSVTANSILRLLPKNIGRIEGGSVRIDGTELTTLSDKEMRKVRGKRISMIFQDPVTSLNPVYTVEKQLVEMICAGSSVTKKQASDHALQMLKKVGIADPERRMKEYPHQLSGGMSQRIMIAMALSPNPEVLIADEPTTALDVTIQAQVLELIKSLQRENDAAVILITHDMGIVAEMADYVMVMYAGEVVEYGTARDIFTNTAHPYTQGLLNSLPRTDREVETLYSIEGTVPEAGEEITGCIFYERCNQARPLCNQLHPDFKIKGGHMSRCHFALGGGEGDA